MHGWIKFSLYIIYLSGFTILWSFIVSWKALQVHGWLLLPCSMYTRLLLWWRPTQTLLCNVDILGWLFLNQLRTLYLIVTDYPSYFISLDPALISTYTIRGHFANLVHWWKCFVNYCFVHVVMLLLLFSALLRTRSDRCASVYIICLNCKQLGAR